jgi:hypothetical protein
MRTFEKSELDIPREYFPEQIAGSVPLEHLVGLEREVQLVQEHIVGPLRYPDIWQNEDKRHHNVMAYGSGGVGKTALAKSVAKESNLHFFNCRPSDIIGHLEGTSTLSFRKMMDTIKTYATGDKRGDKNGVLLLLDEADVILADPSPLQGGANTAAAEFKSQLQDGTSLEGLVVWANTNNPERITDTGVLRRFGLKLYVGLPDSQQRLTMLKNCIQRTYPLEAQAKDLAKLLDRIQREWTEMFSEHTECFSPFEVSEWVNHATNNGELQLRNWKYLSWKQDTGLSTRNSSVEYYRPVSLKIRTLGMPNLTMEQLNLKVRKAKTTGAVVRLIWPVISYDMLVDALPQVKISASLPAMQKLARYAQDWMHDKEGYERICKHIALLQESTSRKRLLSTPGVCCLTEEEDDNADGSKEEQAKERGQSPLSGSPPSSPHRPHKHAKTTPHASPSKTVTRLFLV